MPMRPRYSAMARTVAVAASIVPGLTQCPNSRFTARERPRGLTSCSVTTSRVTMDRVTRGLRVAQEARALGNGALNV
jgi:hypothetical protein